MEESALSGAPHSWFPELEDICQKQTKSTEELLDSKVIPCCRTLDDKIPPTAITRDSLREPQILDASYRKADPKTTHYLIPSLEC